MQARGLCRVHCVLGAVSSSQRTFQCVRHMCRSQMRRMVQRLRRNGLGYVPAGTPGPYPGPTHIGCGSSHWFGLPLERLAGFQQHAHDNHQPARHGNGGALEADPLPQLQALGAPRTVFSQHHDLVEQAPQMARDMPVVIATGPGQPCPDGDGSGFPEVFGVFDGRGEGRRGDRAPMPVIDISRWRPSSAVSPRTVIQASSNGSRTCFRVLYPARSRWISAPK